jgi:hypothetical protein
LYFFECHGVEKSGKIEEGTKVEKMPGRAWGKWEEILGKRGGLLPLKFYERQGKTGLKPD